MHLILFRLFGPGIQAPPGGGMAIIFTIYISLILEMLQTKIGTKMAMIALVVFKKLKLKCKETTHDGGRTTHDDERRPIATVHLSDSGNIKNNSNGTSSELSINFFI